MSWCPASSVHRGDEILLYFWAKWASGHNCFEKRITWTSVCGICLLSGFCYCRISIGDYQKPSKSFFFFFFWVGASFIFTDGILCLISSENNGVTLCSPKLKRSLDSLCREFSALAPLNENLDFYPRRQRWKGISRSGPFICFTGEKVELWEGQELTKSGLSPLSALSFSVILSFK